MSTCQRAWARSEPDTTATRWPHACHAARAASTTAACSTSDPAARTSTPAPPVVSLVTAARRSTLRPQRFAMAASTTSAGASPVASRRWVATSIRAASALIAPTVVQRAPPVGMHDRSHSAAFCSRASAPAPPGEVAARAATTSAWQNVDARASRTSSAAAGRGLWTASAAAGSALGWVAVCRSSRRRECHETGSRLPVEPGAGGTGLPARVRFPNAAGRRSRPGPPGAARGRDPGLRRVKATARQVGQQLAAPARAGVDRSSGHAGHIPQPIRADCPAEGQTGPGHFVPKDSVIHRPGALRVPAEAAADRGTTIDRRCRGPGWPRPHGYGDEGRRSNCS